MEAIGLVVLLPLLILLAAFSLVAANFLGFGYLVLAGFFFLVIMSQMGSKRHGEDYVEQMETVRRIVIAFAIAILLPIFARYLMDAYDAAGTPLGGVLIALALGYAAVLWGIFVHHNKALAFANVLGGAAILAYAYFHLWDLGSLPRIIATAFGLVVAVVIAIVKFQEKLK